MSKREDSTLFPQVASRMNSKVLRNIPDVPAAA
jgi:hypothetical protein